MATEVKLPRLGQGMESGTIVKWLKAEGEPVKKGEPLYELDTDKVTQEVEAEADGVLLKIVVADGEVEVGTTIAVIGSEGEDVVGRSGARRRAGRGEARRRDEPPAPDAGWTTARRGRQPRPRPQRRPSSPRPRAPTAASRRQPARAPASRASGGSTSRRSSGTRPGGPDRRRGRRARRRRRADGRAGAGRRAVRRGRGRRAHLDAQDDRAPPDRGLAGAGLPAHVSADMTELVELRERLVERLREGETKPTVTDVLTKVVAAALVRHPAGQRALHGRQDPSLPVRRTSASRSRPRTGSSSR